MSTSLYYQPVQPTSLCAGCGFIAAELQKVFGNLPIELSTDDLNTLMVMQKLAGATNVHDIYGQLIHAIDEHGTIRVWSE